MKEKKYDIIIIGAGSGGYIAAERAGARGKRVLLVEKEHLGGACLNRGCIPTKTLLHSAKRFYHAQNSEQYGVTVSGANYDLSRAMAWKEQVTKTLRNGVAYLMKKNGVEWITGTAQIQDNSTVTVDANRYKTDNIIIATGSTSIIPSIPGVEMPHVVDSTEILSIDQLPQNLVIIGGGFIGLEFASYFSMVGVEVTVIEMMPEVLPGMDKKIASMLRESMKNCTFYLNATVTSIDERGVTYTQDNREEKAEADLVLMAVGRRPNVMDQGFESIHLDFDAKGIRVNEQMQTNLPGVYAIGDVTGKAFFAYTASRMGEVAVNHICAQPDSMRYGAIPSVVYTNPEVACVGLTEAEAKEQGYNPKTAQLQMRANGRFLAEQGSEKGLCKVIVEEQTDRLLGVHMIGGYASEIIVGPAAMIEAEFRVNDIRQVVFPHPTNSEIVRDSVWDF